MILPGKQYAPRPYISDDVRTLHLRDGTWHTLTIWQRLMLHIGRDDAFTMERHIIALRRFNHDV